MFDFTLVGATVAVVGVAFVGLIGWHLVPVRRQAGTGSFESGKYLSEVRITEGSKVAEMQLREVDKLLDDVDAQIIGLVRHEVRISAPNPRRTLRVGDILVIEIEPESLPSVLTSLGLKLEEDVPAPAEEPGSNQEEAEPDSVDVGTSDATSAPEETAAAKKQPEEILIQELVVMPNTPLVNRSATDIQLRTRFGINLLAISRQGHRSIKRLRLTRLVAGDVLLMQGSTEAVSGFASEYGCLPLAAREIRVPKKGNALIAATIMGIAVAVTALGILPVAVSFATGVLAFTVFGVIPIRSIYTAIDWPVIVLLGAMLPVAGAMASTGAADLIAQFLLDNVARGQAVAGLVVLLVATMLLTDFMNNVATAAVMCPIAISTASQLGVNADAFLMAIAVGSSCAFLTPIGHQNNTLILGAGGFGFGDFWRMGLPTDVLVIAVSVPMLLWVWPL